MPQPASMTEHWMCSDLGPTEGDPAAPVVEEGDKKVASSKKRRWTRLEVSESADWLFVIENQVYKIPNAWVPNHPGGEILLINGRGNDITIPFLNNHRMEVVEPLLKRWHVGEVVEPQSKMETEFIVLLKKVTNDPTWFRARVDFYLGLMIRYALILFASIYCVLYGGNAWIRIGLGGFLMGMFWQQTAFLGHDIGHNGVTHIREVDSMIGTCIGNCIGGISVAWWKATHNVHHLVTNSLEYDCDIQHMPVFAVTPKFFEGVFSEYHFKKFEFDRASQILLQYQHFLYYPILALARFNLYVQSLILCLSPPKTFRKWGGSHQFLEVATLGIFWAWFVTLVSHLPNNSEMIAFLFLSHAVAGILHVQITISHFPMPVIEGNPLKDSQKMNFIEYQLSGSLDVDCPPWMDWFHGGLQFQAVHHLLPRIPRHNLRRLRDTLILPFCEKHGLEYKRAGFVECNRMVIQTLSQTANKVHPFLEHAWNAAG